MDDEQELSIDEIRLWTVPRLKEFLRQRKLKVSGRKDELVALVFSVLQTPELAPVTAPSPSASGPGSGSLTDLLRVEDGTLLPDPGTLTNWESETAAITKWPPTMAFDIHAYLTNIDNVPLKKRLMSDYKEGKAYSYFASGWLKDVQYHEISPTSKYCFLRSECVPSQRIRNIPWKVWVSVEKKSGEIQNAYCTCFAGFSGTCNHVAAVLFKVEFAWKSGLTNPACTAKECGWAAFGAKHRVEPERIKNMNWHKPHFSKRGRNEAESINPPTRMLFSPIAARSTGRQREYSFDELAELLYPDFSEACLFTYEDVGKDQEATSASFTPPSPSSELNVGMVTDVTTSQLPVPLETLADHASCTEDFLGKLPIYSSAAVSELEASTRGQASNPEWFRQRKGRITASICHSVLTKGRRLLDSQGKLVDCAKLVQQILYKKLDENLPSLKYGREMEDDARQKYEIIMREAGHKRLNVMKCGMKVKSDQVYIGASPDGLVSCDCCGEGLLEIKCPSSVAHTVPSPDNLPYLQNDGNISKNHMYYSQVQLQMGVWEKSWCDFFVYTKHGNARIRVPFDQERWDELLVTCEHFFRLKLAKELVTREYLKEG